MPSRNRGTSCDCCCGHGAPSVPLCKFDNYQADGSLADGSFYHESGLTLFASGNADPGTFFDVETFEHGGTVDSHTVQHAPITLANGPGQGTKVNLTVSAAGDFSTGLILWPKAYDSAVPFDPRCALPGFQFKHLNGQGYIRNALNPGEQQYESEGEADQVQPLPFTGLVIEHNEIRYYSLSPVAVFNRCWQGAGSHSWGGMPVEGQTVSASNVATLDGNGAPVYSSVSNWCMDDTSGDITRIGFCYGLTSYDSSWVSRSLGSGTWTLTSFLDRMTGQGCYTGRCNCYHCDITELSLTFNGGRNPLEFQGKTVTLTRTPGTGGVGSPGWSYTGTVNGTATAAKDVQTLTHSGGDLLPNPNPTGLRAFVAARYGTYQQFDVDNEVEVDPASGLAAGDLAAHLNALPGIDVTVNVAGTVAATGGGAMTITSAADGPMNCFRLAGKVTEADGTTFVSSFTFAPLRVTAGNAGGARSAGITLTLDPRFPSASTENATLRALRSCVNLAINLGFRTETWLQASPDGVTLPGVGVVTGPNHDPVYLNFWGAASGYSSCISDANKLTDYYWQGYEPKDPPPSQNSLTEWGWDIDIVE